MRYRNDLVDDGEHDVRLGVDQVAETDARKRTSAVLGGLDKVLMVLDLVEVRTLVVDAQIDVG